MQKKVPMKTQLHKLLYQSLEIERETMRIYLSGLAFAHTQALKDDLEERLGRARAHEKVLLDMFKELGLDPDAVIPSWDEVTAVETSGSATSTWGESSVARSSQVDRDAEAQRMDDEFVLVVETTDVLVTTDALATQQRQLIGHLAEHWLSDSATRVEKSRGEKQKTQKVTDSE